MEENENRDTLITAFVSKPAGQSRFVPRQSFAHRSRRERMRFGAGYLIVRLGICAVCFGAVLTLKLRGSGRTLEAISSAVNSTAEPQDADALGRLKFIDLPSIIEVFAPSDGPIAPVEFTSYRLGEDGFTLCFEAAPRAKVVCPMAGKVTNIGEAEDGVFVTVLSKDDYEFTLSGLASVTAERSQPVAQRQQIGVTAGAALYLRVYRAGRPLDPRELIKSVGKA